VNKKGRAMGTLPEGIGFLINQLLDDFRLLYAARRSRPEPRSEGGTGEGYRYSYFFPWIFQKKEYNSPLLRKSF